MSNVKKESENIVNASKKIGSMYRSAGIQTGKEYAASGKKTAQLFNNLYDCYTDKNEEQTPPKEK